MNRDVTHFIDDYFPTMVAGDAAIFAGAGLSIPAGFVDWRELMRPLANELNLDIDREADFVAIAQFHVNANKNNRSQLHKAIIEALAPNKPPTKNHRILARLPIETWWTTNYDKLLERALEGEGKIIDPKSAVPQLATTRPRRDAVVYKMHGDIERPDEAVVTRDDYERYPKERGAFINALAGDLVSKTFLFIGFSFSDPNLEHVLSQLRITFEKNMRRHYAIFKKRARLKDEDDVSFEHAKIRQALVIEDLQRFNIKVLLIDEYTEITTILEELYRRYRRQTVFVSASAATFDPWGQEQVNDFMRRLGAALVSKKMKIATGLGFGIGNALFTGSLEQIMKERAGHMEDFLVLRPFPYSIENEVEREKIYDQYRRDILAQAGIALFLFGNKRQKRKTIPSDGVRKEFEIARELGLILLPIGATGSVSSILSKEVNAQQDKFLTELTTSQRSQLGSLSESTADLMSLIEPITNLVASIKEGR